jgi:23S rRNA (uracil-5-)-methyltransferase RumA
MGYEDQLALKNKEVLACLEQNQVHIGEYLGIIGSDKNLGYRNKMEYTFGDEFKNGPKTLGLHKRRQFMSIITVDECLLVDQDFNDILKCTLDFFVEGDYPHYNKKDHAGLQRNLIIRKGERTSELLINLVTTTQMDFDKKSWTSRLLALPLQNKIVGILHTTNDSPADFVYCEALEVLYGRDYYTEHILGLSFKVSAFSFFQTNIPAIERLYSTAIGFIDEVSDKTVFDLYSGTGSISQALALKAKRVIGIELVSEAVASAMENSKVNGLTNCTFLEGDVLKTMDQIAERPDVIVLDPPRSGVHPKALQKILNYGVNEIIYISCNPKTLAQDLAVAQESGYRAEKMVLFDNFPHTRHSEAVVKLRCVR